MRRDKDAAHVFSLGWGPSLWTVLCSNDSNTGVGNVASPGFHMGD